MAAAKRSAPHVGVLVFPGSNDDRDLAGAFRRLGAEVSMIWHKDRHLPEGLGGIGIPGGFSYGDYLRAGAMARFSPIMAAVGERAAHGVPVIGICNGFQILCESGLLPGALVRNRDLRFLCADVRVRVEDCGRLGADLEPGRMLRIPIKHGEGCYFAHADDLAALEANGQIVLRYCGPDGEVSEATNPNGSLGNIAGITNRAGNVFGLMPHPEHAVEPAFGGTDGARLLRALIQAGEGASSRSGRAR